MIIYNYKRQMESRNLTRKKNTKNVECNVQSACYAQLIFFYPHVFIKNYANYYNRARLLLLSNSLNLFTCGFMWHECKCLCFRYVCCCCYVSISIIRFFTQFFLWWEPNSVSICFCFNWVNVFACPFNTESRM